MDSMDFFNVLVQMHKRLGVNVSDSVLLELNNMDALLDYIAANVEGYFLHSIFNEVFKRKFHLID